MTDHEAGRDALDGNAAAGSFVDLFAVDITTATVTCSGCGSSAVFAEQSAYVRGPGTVLRCRGCDHVLARVVRTPHEQWLDLAGASSWRFPLPPPQHPTAGGSERDDPAPAR